MLEKITCEPLNKKLNVVLPDPDDSNAYDDVKSMKGRRFIGEVFKW